jgi:hypothetical protein
MRLVINVISLGALWYLLRYVVSVVCGRVNRYVVTWNGV